MKHLFSSFNAQHNASGQLEVEFGSMLGPYLLATLLPTIGAGVAVKMMSGPLGTAWFVLWIGVGVSIFSAVLLLLFFAPPNRARIVIDQKQGKLIIESRGKRTELALKDVARARFDSFTTQNSPSDDGSSGTTTAYRLMLILCSGEEIAANSNAFALFPKSDRRKTLAAIHGALAE